MENRIDKIIDRWKLYDGHLEKLKAEIKAEIAQMKKEMEKDFNLPDFHEGDYKISGWSLRNKIDKHFNKLIGEKA